MEKKTLGLIAGITLAGLTGVKVGQAAADATKKPKPKQDIECGWCMDPGDWYPHPCCWWES